MERKEVNFFRKQNDFVEPLLQLIADKGWNIEEAKYALEKTAHAIEKIAQTVVINKDDIEAFK